MSTRSILTSPNEYEDIGLERLLKTCLQTGDPALWTDFIRLSQPFISSVVVKTLRGSGGVPRIDICDDLVQETYLKLCSNNFKALRQFTCWHERAFYGFLKVVARNVVLDHIRDVMCDKRGRGCKTEAVNEPHLIEAVHHKTRISPEQKIFLRTIDEYLAESARKTGRVRDYVIFWLYYRQGLCARAIAVVPGINLSVKGVESALLRLTHQVRSRFNPKVAVRKTC